MMVSPRTTSPPTTAAPATWHSSRRPSISSTGQVTGSSAGHDEAEQQRGRHGAHGGDVREVLRGGLAADVVGGGPVAAEVPALQQDVGARHDPAVGRGDHRRVVAGPDPDRRGGGEPGGELPDEPELPELTNSALHRPCRPFSSAQCIVPGRASPVSSIRSRRTVDFCSCPHPGARASAVTAGLPAASGDAIPWRSFSPHDPRGRPGGSVVQAYILIQTEVGKASTVAEVISKIPGVIQAEDVTGPYDVIVRAQADTRRRARPHGGRQGPAGGRHHSHPDLPGRPSVAPVYPWPVNFFRHRPRSSRARPSLAAADAAAGCSSADDNASAAVPSPPARASRDCAGPGQGAAAKVDGQQPSGSRARLRADRGLGRSGDRYCAAVSREPPEDDDPTRSAGEATRRRGGEVNGVDWLLEKRGRRDVPRSPRPVSRRRTSRCTVRPRHRPAISTASAESILAPGRQEGDPRRDRREHPADCRGRR